MSTKDDGGAAFPTIDVYTNHEGDVSTAVEDGMSLRDFFAAKAMQALISARCYPWDNQAPTYAYQIADAMLEARKS